VDAANPSPPVLTLQSVNAATYAAAPGVGSPAAKAPDAALIKAEVLLDRAHFSPGVIDGRMGENVKNALTAYAKVHDLPVDGGLSASIWQALTRGDKAPPLTTYVLTPADVAGPWSPNVGEDFVKMSRQKRMGYANPLEMLGERFHMDQALVTTLNPGENLNKAGTPIVVVDPGASTLPPVASIDIDKATKSVTARDVSGNVAAVFPATVGSTERPSPKGSWKVKGVAQNPDYLYDPSKLTWGPRSHGKLHIPPGPNGPVGVVWIALTAPDYGIHGTPDPHLVGKTASHGCVRLTNWDAEELSRAVKPGVSVTFDD
jgi:lipoprotein-anchoring transpeptidase ErfK/SrfK